VEITPDDLLIDIGYRPRGRRARAGSAEGGRFLLPPDGVSLDELENDLVRQAMQRSGNNQSRAASLLRISRDQIRYRLEKLGLIGKGSRRSSRR